MRLLTIVAVLMSSLAFAHPGIGIVKDSHRNIFYTDLTHVWKIDRQGKKTIAVRSVHTHELYIDDKDNLFGEHLWYNGEAADTWGHYVWKLAADGKLSKVIPNTQGFRDDFSFVRDHLGRSYRPGGDAGCQHIKRINSDKSTVKLGDKCLDNIRWMTASSNGDVFVVDGPDLKKVNTSGHISTVAEEVPKAKATQFFINKDHYLGGLTVDAAQNIYVCDFSARDVKKIAKDGTITVVAETSMPWSPSGILLDSNGDLWILEYSVTNDARVERISRDGRRTEF